MLIHREVRDGASRHQIVKLVGPTGKFALCEVIGREDKNRSILGLDFEDRTSLGVKLGDVVSISICKTRIWGPLVWYMTNNDPSIRITAILTVVSFLLGVLGIVLAFKL